MKSLIPESCAARFVALFPVFLCALRPPPPSSPIANKPFPVLLPKPHRLRSQHLACDLFSTTPQSWLLTTRAWRRSPRVCATKTSFGLCFFFFLFLQKRVCGFYRSLCWRLGLAPKSAEEREITATFHHRNIFQKKQADQKLHLNRTDRD